MVGLIKANKFCATYELSIPKIVEMFFLGNGWHSPAAASYKKPGPCIRNDVFEIVTTVQQMAGLKMHSKLKFVALTLSSVGCLVVWSKRPSFCQFTTASRFP